MKHLHRITITVFAKPEENEDRILEGLITLMPFDLAKENITLQREIATGFNDREISIYTLVLERQRHIRAFLSQLTSHLTAGQQRLLISQADSRLDEECNFYLRIDKPEWLNGNLYLTDSGNCYHIKLTLAAYPKNKQAALAIVNTLFRAS